MRMIGEIEGVTFSNLVETQSFLIMNLILQLNKVVLFL